AQGSGHAGEMRGRAVDPRRAHLRRGHAPPPYRGWPLLRSADPLPLNGGTGVLLLAIDPVVAAWLGVQFLLAGSFFWLLYWLAETPVADPSDPPLPAGLPRVLVQIPVYNEPAVVEQALVAAAALDWPRDRLVIQLLDDSTDLTSDIAVHVVGRLRREG